MARKRIDFQCTVITPERKVFDGPVAFVALPAHDGEIGLLPNRAPLVCKLGIGILRLETREGRLERMFVDGGFAQMLDNHLVILTQQARRPQEIDAGAEREALEKARQIRTTDAHALADRRRDIERAAARLKLTQ
jgi:F-type H+-transporting ATPase subunit epsilon